MKRMVLAVLVGLWAGVLAGVASPGTADACTLPDVFDTEELVAMSDDGEMGERGTVEAVVRLTTYEVIPGVEGKWGPTYLYSRSGYWGSHGGEPVEPFGNRAGPERLDTGEECTFFRTVSGTEGGHAYQVWLEAGGRVPAVGSAEVLERFTEVFGAMQPLEELPPQNGRGPADGAGMLGLRWVILGSAVVAFGLLAVFVLPGGWLGRMAALHERWRP